MNLTLNAFRSRRTSIALTVAGSVLAILLLAAFLASWNATQELAALHQGFYKGFELRGTYAEKAIPAGSHNHFSLTPEQADAYEGRWSMGTHDLRAEGFYSSTEDPNYYLIKDDSGGERGWMHVVFAGSNGEGLLYVQYDSAIREMEKVDRPPITFEEAGS